MFSNFSFRVQTYRQLFFYFTFTRFFLITDTIRFFLFFYLTSAESLQFPWQFSFQLFILTNSFSTFPGAIVYYSENCSIFFNTFSEIFAFRLFDISDSCYRVYVQHVSAFKVTLFGFIISNNIRWHMCPFTGKDDD